MLLEQPLKNDMFELWKVTVLPHIKSQSQNFPRSPKVDSWPEISKSCTSEGYHWYYEGIHFIWILSG